MAFESGAVFGGVLGGLSVLATKLIGGNVEKISAPTYRES